MLTHIFDVDGTLTQSRKQITQQHEYLFGKFMFNNSCVLVTGSDKSKTIEQIGEGLWSQLNVYQQSGNHHFLYGTEVQRKELEWDDSLTDWLRGKLKRSQFTVRTGSHIEHRGGLVNFSIVGRNASVHDRAEYVIWDNWTDERETIANEFNEFFSDSHGLIATVAGETGIDITKIGHDKSQILDEIQGDVVFYGDKMEKGGNDYPLAQRIIKEKRGVVKPITNPDHLFKILGEEYGIIRIS